MNAAEYVSLLGGAAVQATSDFVLVFMDYNAPVHRASSVVAYNAVATIP